ncbi:ABC transporter permease [Paenibacillus physcomitrellae]|uniref:Sugar ABC transporter permease n=1 Tax=Paenibacillus physcomitrellae TaxID=1619311 RepID=A0ABQ1GFL6_9BACL|nr:ABC transporter permease subunit [Paenibacillus physcomitrellae]GGA42901.1 sugar ABC transporter permease [Paenibacillus physcomitrellae]
MSSLTLAQSRRKNKKSGKKSWYLFGLAVPFIICMLLFSYFPVYGWIYAFFDYKPGIPLSMTPFVGLDNFKEFFDSSPDLINALINTLAMNFLNLLFSPLAIVFAIMVNEVGSGKYKKFVQTFSTLPNFISWVLVYSLAFAFFSSEGLINTLFGKLGFSWAVDPLAHEGITWFFQTMLTIWKTLGWNAIIYIAAIAGIDSELYDAARVDGANRLRTIWHITIPGVMPTFLVLTLLNISNMLASSFDQYFVFYNPLVAGKIEVLDYYVYRMGIIVGDYPYATAVGIFKTVVSVILLFSVNQLSKRLRGDSLI